MTHKHPTRSNHFNLAPRRSARLSAGRTDHALVKEVLALKAQAKDEAEGWVDGVKVRKAPTVRIVPQDARPTLFERMCSALDRDAQRLPKGLQA